jgi:3-oxocholest-4-en-26-oate---CoA ligase
MELHFATIWESIADVVGDAPAVTQGDITRTWTQYDDRAARLAQAMTDAGLRPNSKVGLYLYNSNEYLEAHYGAFKLRAVPVNVNYRYLDEELWYLLDNSDAEALFFHSSTVCRTSNWSSRSVIRPIITSHARWRTKTSSPGTTT